MGFPITAAMSPRRWLSSTDSCGVCIAGVTRFAVCRGAAGSLMSSTATPVGDSDRLNAFVGNSSVVS